MSFFRYAYNQSEKGLGKAFLFSMVLGLIFALSVLVSMLLTMNSLDETELRQFADETGCQITNYQLVCNEEYYEYEGIIIDLGREELTNTSQNIILTQNYVLLQDGRSFSYEQLLQIGNQGPDFNVNDVSNILNSFIIIIYIAGFVGSFLVGTIFYILANILLAAVMMFIFKEFMKKPIKFDQMYKLTIITVLPYVAFNAVTRMIFGVSFISWITSYMPIGGLIVTVIFDYAIIFGLTYLAVKHGYQEPEEEKVEMPFDVE